MTTDRSEVRRAGREEAGAAARLLHAFNTEFDDPTPGVEVLTQRVAGLVAAGEIIVLLAGEPAAGIAVFRLRPALWDPEGLEAYLEELYVAPERRGNGIGRALLDAVIARARAAGAVRIDLGTEEDDTAARALYESSGFTNRYEPDGTMMLYYERDL